MDSLDTLKVHDLIVGNGSLNVVPHRGRIYENTIILNVALAKLRVFSVNVKPAEIEPIAPALIYIGV